MKKIIQLSIVIILLIFVFAACGISKVAGPNLTLIPTTTSTQKAISTSTSIPTIIPAVTPSPSPTPMGGSSKVVFDDRKCNEQNYCTSSNIYLFDLISNQKTQILKGYYLEGISPDGSKLLVSTNSEMLGIIQLRNLYVVNIDGSNLILLSSKYKQTTYNFKVRNVFWFTDKDLIIFTENNSLSSINPDGSGYTQIAKPIVGVEYFIPIVVNQEIYWKEVTPYAVDYGWHKSNLDGSVTKNLDKIDQPALSNDGKNLAYLYLEGKELFITKTDNSPGSVNNVANISDFANYFLQNEGRTIDSYTWVDFMPPVWLPDNNHIMTMLRMSSRECNECQRQVSFSQPFIISTTGEITWLDRVTGYFEPYYLFDSYSFSPDRKIITYYFTEEKEENSYARSIKALDLISMKTITIKSDIEKYNLAIVMYWLPY